MYVETACRVAGWAVAVHCCQSVSSPVQYCVTMFESITETAKPTPRWLRAVMWVAGIGLPIVAVIAVLALARRPAIVLIVAGVVLWLPLLGVCLSLSRAIEDDGIRAFARAALWALFLTPSIVVGEGGLAPAPAL